MNVHKHFPFRYTYFIKCKQRVENLKLIPISHVLAGRFVNSAQCIGKNSFVVPTWKKKRKRKRITQYLGNLAIDYVVAIQGYFHCLESHGFVRFYNIRSDLKMFRINSVRPDSYSVSRYLTTPVKENKSWLRARGVFIRFPLRPRSPLLRKFQPFTICNIS